MWPGKRVFCDSVLLRSSGPYSCIYPKRVPRDGLKLRAVLRWLVAALALTLVPPVARAATFPLAPGQTLVGEAGLYVTKSEDTLLDVARNNDLGYGQLMAVNRDVDPWLPGAGRDIALPSVYLLPPGPRKGIVVDLAAHRLFYFPPDGRTVETFPIGVGAEAGMTPRGTTRIVAKIVRPAWYPPKSIRKEEPDLPGMVPPGPSNPLGDYAFRLGWPSYLIHGTNKPYGVGRNVSHGCIRLYPEDIKKLFSQVTVGTPVRVIDDAIRVAWIGDTLYLALPPSRAQMDEISENQPITPQVPPQLRERIVAAAGDRIGRIDWNAVSHAGETRSGVPVTITHAPPLPAAAAD
jgi:L,D-transpeptidase ErfK/SrfK